MSYATERTPDREEKQGRTTRTYGGLCTAPLAFCNGTKGGANRAGIYGETAAGEQDFGSEKKKVDPDPFALVTHTHPPWSST